MILDQKNLSFVKHLEMFAKKKQQWCTKQLEKKRKMLIINNWFIIIYKYVMDVMICLWLSYDNKLTC